MRINFNKTTFTELFTLYAQIRAWAQANGVWGQGNIVGSYTEHLAAEALGLTLAPPATPGYDAVDKRGEKYQIKGLFDSKYLWSGFSSQEKLQTFDYLLCVIYDDSGAVLHAHILPQKVVVDAAVFGAQNKWWLYYKDELWRRNGVRNVTKLLSNTKVSSAASG